MNFINIINMQITYIIIIKIASFYIYLQLKSNFLDDIDYKFIND